MGGGEPYTGFSAEFSEGEGFSEDSLRASWVREDIRRVSSTVLQRFSAGLSAGFQAGHSRDTRRDSAATDGTLCRLVCG